MTIAETKVVLEKDTVEARVKDVVEALNLEKVMKKYEKIDSLLMESVLDIHKLITNLVVEIHPFFDGNRRASRIIQNDLLSNIDRPRLIIRPKDKQFYYKALEDATVYGDRKVWIRFSLEYILFMCINGIVFIKEIR